MLNKIKILLLLPFSFILKVKTYCLLLFKKRQIIKRNDNPKLIVSLTSYGKRVGRCAPYAIMSALMQKNVIIDKIILTLDKKTWNENNLPWALKKLIGLGVDVLFVEDTKSYTKLLPVLSIYQNSIIITIDDDVYYSSNMVKKLYDEHLRYPDDIITAKARVPVIHDHKINISYKYWREAEYNKEYAYIVPLGYGGILYPPNSLDKEVFNSGIFLKLAPCADDLWFWIIAVISKTRQRVINNRNIVYYPIDFMYQKINKGSALAEYNIHSNNNDRQVQALIDYYNLKL